MNLTRPRSRPARKQPSRIDTRVAGETGARAAIETGACEGIEARAARAADVAASNTSASNVAVTSLTLDDGASSLSEASRSRRRRRTFAAAALVAAALLVAAGGYYLFARRARRADAGAQVGSIAVLPFKSLGAGEPDQYLGLGMADALITKLSSIHQINVRPTSSIIKYAGDGQDIAAADRGYVHAASGRATEARQALGELQQVSQRRYVSPYGIAEAYAGLGRRDDAFEWLAKALKARDNTLVFIEVDPRLDALRSDARFAQLIKDVSLPQ